MPQAIERLFATPNISPRLPAKMPFAAVIMHSPPEPDVSAYRTAPLALQASAISIVGNRPARQLSRAPGRCCALALHEFFQFAIGLIGQANGNMGKQIAMSAGFQRQAAPFEPQR